MKRKTFTYTLLLALLPMLSEVWAQCPTLACTHLFVMINQVLV